MSSESPICKKLDALLRELPFAEEQAADEYLDVSGVLAYSEPGIVRILIADYCLSFDLADIQDAVQVPGENENHHAPPQIRLILRGPARLLNIEGWKEFDKDKSGMPRPFALAVRTHQFVVSHSAQFQSREQEFFRTFEKKQQT